MVINEEIVEAMVIKEEIVEAMVIKTIQVRIRVMTKAETTETPILNLTPIQNQMEPLMQLNLSQLLK